MSNLFGISNFYNNNNRRYSGNSFTLLTDEELIELIMQHWDKRTPGTGETEIDRKVLVPLPASDMFHCSERVKLVEGMPLKSRVKIRQDGEDPYIETYITPDDAFKYDVIPAVATSVNVVCYSSEALLENGGKRTTDCDWEVVTLLCSTGNIEPMLPLAMARNMLKKPGGTYSEYSAIEFAEAIYHHASKSGVKVSD